MIPRHGQWPRAAAFVMTVAFASLLVGCSTEVRKLPVTYLPQQNVHAIKDADAVRVEVTVEDLETEEYWSFPETLNPFRHENTLRFHVKDAAETVKSAAETELKARGFTIAGGGALVTIQLDRFAAETESDNWDFDATARGYFSMRIQVRPQNGNALFSKTVTAEGDALRGTSWTLGLHPATHELQESLTEALKGLFADPAFTAAILATRQQPPPSSKPASPGRIA